MCPPLGPDLSPKLTESPTTTTSVERWASGPVGGGRPLQAVSLSLRKAGLKEALDLMIRSGTEDSYLAMSVSKTPSRFTTFETSYGFRLSQRKFSSGNIQEKNNNNKYYFTLYMG